MPITTKRWSTTRSVLTETGDRFAALVEASDPRAMATADWSVADTAAHVTAIASMHAGVLRAGRPAIPELVRQVLRANVDTVSELNVRMLELFEEREPAALGERLRAGIADMLAATEDTDPQAPVTWLGGSRVPGGGLLAHLINELQIHGRDIARAVGRPWHIPPADAALFFDVFFVELLRHDIGRLLDNDEPARERRIAVEFRSAHTTPVTIVLHRGEVSVEEPGGETDLRITFDPTTLNLMVFHRISKARAALSGKVRIWGPRPWLLPVFLRTVRCP